MLSGGPFYGYFMMPPASGCGVSFFGHTGFIIILSRIRKIHSLRQRLAIIPRHPLCRPGGQFLRVILALQLSRRLLLQHLERYRSDAMRGSLTNRCTCSGIRT